MSAAVTMLGAARFHIKDVRANPAVIVLGIVQPTVFLSLLLAAGPGSTPGGVPALTVGTALISLWSSLVWSSGMLLHREIRMGTMSQLLVRPADLRVVVAGKAVGTAVIALVAVGLVCAVVPAAFGSPVEVARPGLLVLVVLLAVVNAGAFGLLLAALFLVVRSAARLAEALMYPVFIVGGALVPLGALPPWARWPSALLSLRWLREVALSAVDGSAVRPVALGAIAVSTVGYLVAGSLIFGRLTERARESGNVDLN
ncbi:ABC transporter permease [Kitasatospora sp. GAS1066B]|uniref:ABC transporter permease n=1 Tax=Kitasatospora sp. GAS1066B TaxID=3156271 RepID=UPI0035130873